jgi:ATP-dependent DNA ligase
MGASEVVARWMVDEVITYGGEGIILRKPLSLYEHGRSNSLVKYKVIASLFYDQSRLWVVDMYTETTWRY